MSAATQTTTTLVNVSCTCGMVFSAPQRFTEQRKQDGQTFYCPAGHHLHYKVGPSPTENLQKRLEWEQQESKQQRARAESAERSVRSVRGHVTRLRKRLVDGKCPCCSREFPDIATHIAEKHPKYRPADEG